MQESLQVPSISKHLTNSKRKTRDKEHLILYVKRAHTPDKGGDSADDNVC